MMTDTDAPIALQAFEKLAVGYAARAATKAENGYNEHPAMRAQIGDVEGKRVLDAGCGPGFLSQYLLDARAASVTAFDISPQMVRLATERVGKHATLFVSDMAKPIPQVADDSMDVIVSSLAIDYVRDWSVPLREFRRVLVSGGRFILSVQHPMGAQKWYNPPNPFGVHLCSAEWTGFTETPVEVHDYYRSFEEIIMPLIEAGFELKAFKETKPVKALEDIDPRKYRRGHHWPTFIVFECRQT